MKNKLLKLKPLITVLASFILLCGCVIDFQKGNISFRGNNVILIPILFFINYLFIFYIKNKQIKKSLVCLPISCIILLGVFTINNYFVPTGMKFILYVFSMLAQLSIVFLLIYYLYFMIFVKSVREKFKNSISSYMKNKTIIIISIITAILLCLFEAIGLLTSGTFVLNNIGSIIKYAAYLLVVIIIFFISFLILYNKLIDYKDCGNKFNSKKIFFISWTIMFCVYFFYFLQYFPGVLTPDSINQLKQVLGEISLNNHHPVLNTLILKLFFQISKNNMLNICLYSITQMLLLSFTFAYSLKFMVKNNVNKYLILLSFIFYAFVPINIMYSFTVWKDIPFAICTLFLMLSLFELAKEPTKFMSSLSSCIMLSVQILLVCLFRNNGIYIIILLVPCIIFIFKKYYKKLLFIFFIPIIGYFLITNIIYKKYEIASGSIREALSIPLQQIARVSYYHSNDLTDDEKDKINMFLDYDVIKEVYNPILSDPVKITFKDEEFDNNKQEFLKIWYQLLKKYPLTYIKSFAYNSSGYYYPENIYWVVAEEIDENDFGIERASIINPISSMANLSAIIRVIPVFSMMISVGFAFWINLIAMIILIIKRNYRFIIINLFFIFLWLTLLASPVSGEFRYMYGLFVSLPLLITLSLINTNFQKDATKTTKSHTNINEFIRYIIVGGMSFVIDFITLYIMRDLIFSNNNTVFISSLSAFIAFMVSFAFNYIVSAAFVFDSTKTNKKSYKVITKVLIVACIGLLLTEFIMYVGEHMLFLNYKIVKIISSILVLVWNYIGRKIFVYKS